ncbi:MAG: family 16 glycoside hydrolase, partial [Saprospiraceae bacterium]
MKNFLIIFFVLSFISAQSQVWTSLFDGKTLKGWKQLNGKAKYKVENGQIIGSTVTNTPNSFLV